MNTTVVVFEGATPRKVWLETRGQSYGLFWEIKGCGINENKRGEEEKVSRHGGK